MSTDASNGMIHMIKVANEYYPDFSVRHVRCSHLPNSGVTMPTRSCADPFPELQGRAPPDLRPGACLFVSRTGVSVRADANE